MLCIKKVREEKGVSLYWLAKTTGLAYRNLWDIERGADFFNIGIYFRKKK